MFLKNKEYCLEHHLVIGSQPCTICNQEKEPRWEKDPYILSHAEMAYERGLLKGEELNDVQIGLLICQMSRLEKLKRDEVEAQFEQNMFVTNPELYKVYKEQKDREIYERGGLEKDPIWIVPETQDEAEYINSVMAELDKKFKKQLLEQVEQGEEIGPHLKAFLGDISLEDLGDEE